MLRSTHFRGLATALTLLAALPAAAVAQNFKPVAVVSLASVRESLDDFNYLAQTAGMEDAGKSASFLASALTAGLDKTRPGGVYVVPKEGDFHWVGFLPIEPNGLSTMLKVHQENIGEPKDVGDGVLEIGMGRTVFVKEQGGFAFAADSKDHLASLPADPVALLGDLPQKYNLAAKLMVQNVPQELRRMVIDEIKLGMERALESPALRRGNLDRQNAAQFTQTWLTNLERLMNEADEVWFGLGVDAPGKRTMLDIGASAKEGTALARQMALQTQAKTQFAGLLMPEASVTLSVASQTSPEDIEQVRQAMQASRGMYARQLDDAPNIPADKREALKSILNQVFDLVEKTVAEGKMDGGAALLLMPKSISFVGGGLVADGAALEKIFKDALELAQGQPNVPQLQTNVGKLGDIRLHKLSAAIPAREAEAREMLGDPLEIYLGVGPKRFYIAGGKNAQDLLKKTIDASAAAGEQAVPPMQLNIALLPILKFYSSVDDNPIVGQLIASLEQTGGDRITLVNRATATSSVTRLEIQEGIIKAGGSAAKALGAGRGGRGGGL